MISANEYTTAALLLEEAVNRLVEAFSPEKIFLFGPRSRGDAGAGSDFDLMVVVPESNQPHYKRSQEAYRVLWGITATHRCPCLDDGRVQ